MIEASILSRKVMEEAFENLLIVGIGTLHNAI